jgi:chromosome segregation ATPase
VLTIESFETSLRENTPLTSISDPKALSEYLNQVNLQGDMVLDELKRVSSDRDAFKHKLSEAEQSAKQAWDEVANLREGKGSRVDNGGDDRPGSSSHLENVTVAEDVTDGDPLGATTKSPPHSTTPPINSVRRMSPLSPKLLETQSSKPPQGSQDLFSYEDEVPRLEIEIKDRQNVIEGLEKEVRSLKGDLSVTRESTQSMVQTLEEATRELNSLRDGKDRSGSDLKEQKYAAERLSEKLRGDLQSAEDKLKTLEAQCSSGDSDRTSELDVQLQATKQELEEALSVNKHDRESSSKIEELHGVIDGLESKLSNSQATSERNEKKVIILNELVAALRLQLTKADEKQQDLRVVVEKSSKAAEGLRFKVDQLEAGSVWTQSLGGDRPDGVLKQDVGQGPLSTTSDIANIADMSNVGKKKNKKRKKGGKTSSDQGQDTPLGERQDPGPSIAKNEKSNVSDSLFRALDELRRLRDLLEEKNAAIDRLHGKLKDQDGLSEEVDTLRDDLINVGQEHVEAKDKVKILLAEKIALEDTVTDLERELTDLRNVDASNAAGSEHKHEDLTAQFEDLKVKAITLQTDLSAAQQLASSRFKDLNDLRNILQKAQPEINALRSEAAEVKSVKETLSKKDADLQRLESRHEEMRSEVTSLKEIITERESGIESLSLRLNQESRCKITAEAASSKANQDVQRLDSEKRRVAESLDRLTTELERAREELLSSRSMLNDFEQQLSNVRRESEGFKEEIELKTAQYASTQSLMASMRDQTAEMAMQMREARERCESLDEEVADAHRLLGERSREAETIRRLLADMESRADARTREMKERMDTAIEERDRAEDEASTAGRRKARELEDLKTKYRDLERTLKRAEEDKDELEFGQRDWKRRREELEHRVGQSTKEAEEMKTAMGDLRDALDESEKRSSDLEKQKAELRRSVEDAQHRLEKLQKSNKVRT